MPHFGNRKQERVVKLLGASDILHVLGSNDSSLAYKDGNWVSYLNVGNQMSTRGKCLSGEQVGPVEFREVNFSIIFTLLNNGSHHQVRTH
jgi:hypothetical protein